MEEKDYTVEGRQFFTESDYARAKRDKKLIDELRQETDFSDLRELELLKKRLQEGRYRFLTILGRDFLEEIEVLLKKAGRKPPQRGQAKKQEKRSASGRQPEKRRPPGTAAGSLSQRRQKPGETDSAGKNSQNSQWPAEREGRSSPDSGMDVLVAEELRRRDRRRRLIIALCSVIALGSLAYFAMYSYYTYRTDRNYQELIALKEKSVAAAVNNAVPTEEPPLYTLDGESKEKEVLDEYKNLLIKNKKLIGWLKIDDTNIDCPVMQTTDNEYYLDHNTEQEYDKNGSIFMDKDCDVLKPSTNFILYGHHMLNGKMFGKLYLYEDEEYGKEHQYISFDTIYEKGTYQVMYVFRSEVYTEADIVFKYYQFIDANSEQEFDSYMQEMAAMSFYDTGVTAEYGDQLLTLSTCDDYQRSDGRFVVVAKKIAKE